MSQPRIQILVQNRLDSGIGKISAAAHLQWSSGTPGRRLRRLGCYALVYVLAGGGRYRDNLGNKEAVRAGDLLLLMPDIAHAYGPGPGRRWDEIYVLFEGPVFDLWRAQGVLGGSCPVVSLTPIPAWRARLEQVWGPPLSPLDSVCRLQAFLSAIRQGPVQPDGDREPAWMNQARHCLAEAPDRAVDLPGIARTLGMSYESFRKGFCRYEGISPGQYRRRRIMDEAARLLVEQDLPLKQVAEATGFCDEFHFSRQFKKILGIAPGAYRRRFARA